MKVCRQLFWRIRMQEDPDSPLTYTDHLFYAETLGVPIDRVPLKDDLSIDLETMRSRVGNDTAMVYLANPNNPTGIR